MNVAGWCNPKFGRVQEEFERNLQMAKRAKKDQETGKKSGGKQLKPPEPGPKAKD